MLPLSIVEEFFSAALMEWYFRCTCDVAPSVSMVIVVNWLPRSLWMVVTVTVARPMNLQWTMAQGQSIQQLMWRLQIWILTSHTTMVPRTHQRAIPMTQNRFCHIIKILPLNRYPLHQSCFIHHNYTADHWNNDCMLQCFGIWWNLPSTGFQHQEVF